MEIVSLCAHCLKVWLYIQTQFQVDMPYIKPALILTVFVRIEAGLK